MHSRTCENHSTSDFLFIYFLGGVSLQHVPCVKTSHRESTQRLCVSRTAKYTFASSIRVARKRQALIVVIRERKVECKWSPQAGGEAAAAASGTSRPVFALPIELPPHLNESPLVFFPFFAESDDECLHHAVHERLGELLRVLKIIISKHQSLNSVDILSTAGTVIATVKGEPPRRSRSLPSAPAYRNHSYAPPPPTWSVFCLRLSPSTSKPRQHLSAGSPLFFHSGRGPSLYLRPFPPHHFLCCG